jgi:hypothetical protein
LCKYCGKKIADFWGGIMGKKTVAAPNYTAAAKAQGDANLEAQQQSIIGQNPNVTNPYGTQTVTWTTDESGNKIPNLNQTFSPEQQALYEKETANQGLLADLAGKGATAAGSVIGQNLDLSGAPAAPGNYDTTRKSVYDAMMGRVNEDYANTTDQTNSKLIAAGLRPGSKAYDNQMFQLQRGRNDAMQQAQLGAGAEAERAFGMDTTARKNAIAEILAQRQTPLNEITALMSGSQVQNPFSMPGYTGSGVNAPDYYGAVGDTYQAKLAAANAKNAGIGNAMSGLFSIGSAFAGRP